MGRIEKTVFLSYRRTNGPWALAIFQDLTYHGFDVFFDFNGIGSGDFEGVIVENIRDRAHFVVLLTRRRWSGAASLETCFVPRLRWRSATSAISFRSCWKASISIVRASRVNLRVRWRR
jgi:hypothetical protein